MRRALIAALVLTVAVPGAAAAQQGLAGWSTIETEHFRFHFPPDPRVKPEPFGVAEEQAFSRLQETRLVRDVEASLAPAARGDAASTQESGAPSLEALRAQAQERMRQDRNTYSPDQMREIESMYQAAARDLRAPESRERLRDLVRKYPTSNRAGCSVLYLARMSEGTEKEEYLQTAIANHSDARFGDGAQVGAFARAELAMFYANSGATDKARALAEEVRTMYPGAVAHNGTRLEDALRRMKLLD